MLKVAKRLGWAALIVSVSAFLLYVLFSTTSYQICIADKEKEQPEKATEKTLPEGLRPLIMGARIKTNCIFFFLYENREAITAVATAFIAFFTLTLWHSTRNLWKLARSEFIATHRPKITMRAVKLHLEGAGVGGTYPIEFTYVNEGESTAYISKIGSNVFNNKTCWTYGARKVRFTIETSTEILQSGEERTHPTPDKFDWNLSDTNWFCVGYVEYRDSLGIIRKTGFCRRWNDRKKVWVREENEEYEYSY